MLNWLTTRSRSVFPVQPLPVQTLVSWFVLAAVALLVLYPVALIVLNSFQKAGPLAHGGYSLDAWAQVLSDSSLLTAVWNTIRMTLARQLIAFPLAIVLAWVLARTDIPGARWLEFCFWIAFFIPPLAVVQGWILLLDPQYGLLNQLALALPFVHHAPFNIYSFWGIVWVHLVTTTLAIKVMLLIPAFRNLDATFEEASSVSGAGRITTLIRVVVPLLAPTLLVVVLLSTVYSLQSFEIELTLGFPFRFMVFSTQIYFLILQDPPEFPAATALASMILAMMLPLVGLQRWTEGRKNYEVIGGRFTGRLIRLGRWRPFVFAMVLAIGLLITVCPVVFLLLATVMKLFGFFNMPNPWTLNNWTHVLSDKIFLHSLWNTVVLAGTTAFCSVVFFTVIAYVIARTRFRGRTMLEFTAWLPAAVPGIILGLGLLWIILGVPALRPLYGSIAAMILATVIGSMSVGVQLIRTNLVQLGQELEEAARVGGGTVLQALRHVVIPIIAPTLLLVGALSFIAAARNVSTVALLATSNTRPLALLQVDYMVNGRYESAAVVGVIVVLLTTGVALLARLFGLRHSISNK